MKVTPAVAPGRVATRVRPVAPRVGTRSGSLLRIQRDVRFSKDKSPYKTSVGIRFPHRDRTEVHAPGFYLHLEPGASFAGIGVWHPEPPSLERIRQAVVRDPRGFGRAVDAPRFRKRHERGGDVLSRPPRGYDPDHPLVEELKRKDFIAMARLDDREVLGASLTRPLAETFREGAGFVRFPCRAVDVPF